ncbi:MAG: ribosome biogenesis/translation initiation ATPase RLI [Thermoplasmata archaeon]|nr:ribosome biogenesis/translation initiation ATPase RLI [Thermoplasmata archaeon]
MRIAVIIKDRCQPKRCFMECVKYCPKMRMGTETITFDEKGFPVISEELCAGCGICVHKCPFAAIKIINLAEELKTDLVHQFGQNGFRLYRLPAPKEGLVTGILGENGIGKTTALSILTNNLVPNFGEWEKGVERPRVIEHFSGTELRDYFEKLYDGKIRTSLKPQYVDKIPKVTKGTAIELLQKIATPERIKALLDDFGFESQQLEKNIGSLSGGELQRLAIMASVLKDAEAYFFDEPSSYLDIYQRMKMAKIIRELAKQKIVVVVEHDLAVLDYLADNVHLLYGSEGAYGVVVPPKAVRVAINTYLEGYLKEENIRVRDYPIEFFEHPPPETPVQEIVLEFTPLRKTYDNFTLKTEGGTIRKGEVIGMVGANATGKTTFVKMLAGVEKPDEGCITRSVKVSYKPQYINPEENYTVRQIFAETLKDIMFTNFYKEEIEHPLKINPLYDKNVTELSGGELQRTAIALCLAQPAEIYLLDEPSAYLDSNQRMIAAKTIKRVISKTGMTGMVVDHDIYFIDLVADRMIVFDGVPGKLGKTTEILSMRDGMNAFLKSVNITFRRDETTKRPRVNKPDSAKDREQKEAGEYYYA